MWASGIVHRVWGVGCGVLDMGHGVSGLGLQGFQNGGALDARVRASLKHALRQCPIGLRHKTNKTKATKTENDKRKRQTTPKAKPKNENENEDEDEDEDEDENENQRARRNTNTDKSENSENSA